MKLVDGDGDAIEADFDSDLHAYVEVQPAHPNSRAEAYCVALDWRSAHALGQALVEWANSKRFLEAQGGR